MLPGPLPLVKEGRVPGDKNKYSVDVAMKVEGMVKYYISNVVSVY